MGIVLKRKIVFFCYTKFTMQLMMYIGNDLIEAVNVDRERIPKPGYLGNFKRCLKVKYSDLIKQAGTPPDFLVINNSPVTTGSFTNDNK